MARRAELLWEQKTNSGDNVGVENDVPQGIVRVFAEPKNEKCGGDDPPHFSLSV